jgi:hypothetical protein
MMMMMLLQRPKHTSSRSKQSLRSRFPSTSSVSFMPLLMTSKMMVLSNRQTIWGDGSETMTLKIKRMQQRSWLDRWTFVVGFFVVLVVLSSKRVDASYVFTLKANQRECYTIRVPTGQRPCTLR